MNSDFKPAKVMVQPYRLCCEHCDLPLGPFEHLEPGCSTLWGCEECGGRTYIKIDQERKPWTKAKPREEERSEKAQILLRYQHDHKLQLVVHGSLYFTKGDTVEEATEHADYLYNEHSCPSNFLGGNRLVYEGNDDPHGIFEFVRVLDESDPLYEKSELDN